MTQKENCQIFVSKLFAMAKENPGVRAALRQATSPTTETRAWPILIRQNVNISSPEKEAYCLVASAIAHSSSEKDGSLSFGKALQRSFENGSENSGAESRLLRILSCDSIAEVCGVLKPVLRLIESRQPGILFLGGLLYDLVGFNDDRIRQIVKERWATDFYRKEITEDAK